MLGKEYEHFYRVPLRNLNELVEPFLEVDSDEVVEKLESQAGFKRNRGDYKYQGEGFEIVYDELSGVFDVALQVEDGETARRVNKKLRSLLEVIEDL